MSKSLASNSKTLAAKKLNASKPPSKMASKAASKTANKTASKTASQAASKAVARQRPSDEVGRKAKPYDLVVFGASSFVGKIICRYLLARCAEENIRWAMAGRSMAKMQQLQAELGNGAKKIPLIAADADDAASLGALCASTKVVLSTVGPYALYGEPMVLAAVNAGIDYLDLTGEPQWVRQMIAKYQAQARKSGARIVHTCGFDSVPSDMGVWFLQQAALKQFGEPCQHISMGVKAMQGGASGGTVASMLNAVQSAAKNPAQRRDFANPYSLCLDGNGKTVANSTRQLSQKSARFDRNHAAWSAPFIMAAVNVRVVLRSNFLEKQAYGADFRYEELMLTGTGIKGRMRALAITAGLAGFMTAAVLAPTRWLMQRLVLPAPGSGPSEASQANGFYDLRFVGKTRSGKTLRCKVLGDRDPGYGSTAKIISELALCLLENPATKSGAGFPTPAVALGARLLNPLKRAGVTFEMES